MITSQNIIARFSYSFWSMIMLLQPLVLLLNYINYLYSLKSQDHFEFGPVYMYDKIAALLIALILNNVMRKVTNIICINITLIMAAIAAFESLLFSRAKYFCYFMLVFMLNTVKNINIFSGLSFRFSVSLNAALYFYHALRITIFTITDPTFPVFASVILLLDYLLFDSISLYIHYRYNQFQQAQLHLNEDFKSIFSLIPYPIIVYDKDKRAIVYSNQSSSKHFSDPVELLNIIYSSDILNKRVVTPFSYNKKLYTLLSSLLKAHVMGKDAIIISLNDITDITIKEKEIASENAKWLFINTANHQIRTPLAGIESTLSLLQNSIEETNDKKLMLNNLDIALFSVVNLRHLVDDTLLFCEDSENSIKLANKSFNIESICKNISKAFEFETYSKPIVLKVDHHCYPFSLMGDEKRIFHVLYTLISNAFKYTIQGQINLNYEILSMQSKALLKMQISDTGIGIEEDDRASLFSIFENAEKKKIHAKVSSGISLYVVKRLCELMEGNIAYTTASNHGTTFNIQMLLEVDFKTPKISFIKRPFATGQRTLSVVDLKCNKILIADDNTSNLYVVTSMLSRIGLNCDIAHDGKESVEKFERGSYKLVLMDINMPVMNGLEASKKIKVISEGRMQSVVIIALSAQDEPMGNLKEYGINQWLVKPLKMENLKLLVKEIGLV